MPLVPAVFAACRRDRSSESVVVPSEREDIDRAVILSILIAVLSPSSEPEKEASSFAGARPAEGLSSLSATELPLKGLEENASSLVV
jgi:hypothetical protein